MSFRILSKINTSTIQSNKLGTHIYRNRFIRKYTNQKNQNQNGIGNQNISEIFNEKTIKSAWNILTPNQKLIFGGLVIIGAYFEYTLLDKFLLKPIKIKKENENRLKMEKELGINLNEFDK
ncbi:uncharacterized protein I206_104125 [Kwoniella pini CBS 10737]|uniref:Uncharacterized protein n=1 Tax=Kwoniella pini CBS 10737 TaxID=1296096 RepID=A0A1B9I2L1_9TREE|nr:uncharacterized protein I206_04299 [Kwoniella pini CBS 10737]OCF49773.1 hypothetical protein I206_04299 [Kwoniella pini CBS 10737]